MPIRIARHSDLPRLSEILAASFGPDRLFQVMFPRQHEYHEDFVRALRQKLTESWWDYRKIIFCSYKLVNDENGQTGSEREVLTGMVEWELASEGWERLWNIWGRWDPRNLIKRFVAMSHYVSRLIWPDRATGRPTVQEPDPLTYYNFIQKTIPYTVQFFNQPWRKNHWSLEVLAVHPDYQGQVFGRELATWGLERARSESLPSVVIAAGGKEGFYRRCGFDLLVGWASQGVDEHGNQNPMAQRGVGGGAILWTKVKEDEDPISQ